MKKIYMLLFTMIACYSCKAQNVELNLNLDAGKKYKQVTSTNATISQDINGQKIDMVMTINGVISYLVKAVNENDYDMKVKYESLSLSMK